MKIKDIFYKKINDNEVEGIEILSGIYKYINKKERQKWILFWLPIFKIKFVGGLHKYYLFSTILVYKRIVFNKNINKLKGYDELFFLKVNRDDWLVSLQEHINAINAIGGKYVIQCDKKNIIKKIFKTINFGNNVDGRNIILIKTCFNKFMKLSKRIVEKYWYKCTYAQLTTFYYAKKLGVKSFWNIDADDTYFYLEPENYGKLYQKVKEIADTSDINCLSYDMHYSRLKHWSFGITYIKNNFDYLGLIENTKSDWYNKMPIKLPTINLDWLFNYYIVSKKIKCRPFYVENVFFSHTGFNGSFFSYFAFALQYHKDKFFHNCMREVINNKHSKTHLDENYVKIDLGISFEDSIQFINGRYTNGE